jgi:hypothetical protein
MTGIPISNSKTTGPRLLPKHAPEKRKTCFPDHAQEVSRSPLLESTHDALTIMRATSVRHLL